MTSSFDVTKYCDLVIAIDDAKFLVFDFVVVFVLLLFVCFSPRITGSFDVIK